MKTVKRMLLHWLLPSTTIVLWVLLIILPVLAIVAAIDGSQHSSTQGRELPPMVEAYRPQMTEICNQYGMAAYVNILLAIMAYETGGVGYDPMNSSTSSFNTQYPQEPNGIKDPLYSIIVAVETFEYLKDEAGLESPAEIEKLKLVVQAYNFGGSYIGWALAHADGGYTLDNASEYSGLRARELNVEIYGNPYYVVYVMQFYKQPGISGSGIFEWPLPGFDNVTCEFNEIDKSGRNHRGMDISSNKQVGAPIVAGDSGTVVIATWHDSWGNYIKIDHGNGYSSLYAHCNSLAVYAGQTVGRGECIAYVGSTGDSTGPHLHLEVELNGVLINPREVL